MNANCRVLLYLLAAMGLILLSACSMSAPEQPELGTLSRGSILSASAGDSLATLTLEVLSKKHNYPGFISLLGSGAVAGLGSDSYEIELKAEGNAIIGCFTRGGNFAPGVNLPFVATSDNALGGADSSDRNGRYPFSMAVSEAGIRDELAGLKVSEICPSGNWQLDIAYIDYEIATFTLYKLDAARQKIEPFADQVTLSCATSSSGRSIVCDSYAK